MSRNLSNPPQVKKRVTSPPSPNQPNPATHHQQDTQGQGSKKTGRGSLASDAIPIAAGPFGIASARVSPGPINRPHSTRHGDHVGGLDVMPSTLKTAVTKTPSRPAEGTVRTREISVLRTLCLTCYFGGW